MKIRTSAGEMGGGGGGGCDKGGQVFIYFYIIFLFRMV